MASGYQKNPCSKTLFFAILFDMWNKFWNWYERNLALNLGISAFLFTLQLGHLLWLLLDVVIPKLTGGTGLFPLNSVLQNIIILVDYTEIPAIITTSLVYINTLRKQYNHKDLLYLIFLNSQWLHLFWITDEFVLEQFSSSGGVVAIPLWLAWVAILIDYLELPVIYETLKRFVAALREEEQWQEVFKE